MRVNPRQIGLVLLSATLQIATFPMAGPLPTWRSIVGWFAVTPMLLVLLEGSGSLRQRVALGYTTGILYYGGTCYWIYVAMHNYGGLAAPVAAFILGLFCLYLGLYHALFSWAVVTLSRSSRFGVRGALLLSPLLWVAAELALARVTSVPWDLLGYSQVDNLLLTPLARVTGVYGISFVLMAGTAAIAALLLRAGSRVFAGAVVVCAMALQVGGWVWRPVGAQGAEAAILMQPNLIAGVNGDAGGANPGPRFARETAAVTPESPRIILWPESPSPFATNHEDFLSVLAGLAKAKGSPVIAGAVGVVPDRGIKRGVRIYNSAVAMTTNGVMGGRYDKIHLVPFGEFVPYEDVFSFASGLTQAVGTFDRGVSREPIAMEGHRYGVFLCYESIFGDEVRQFARNGAQVLVNLSDDGWYGDTSAPFQHVNMARMRAIENSRWVLRDTNNGITAAIDPQGRMVETMPRHVERAAEMHFNYRSDMTFYTRFGDVFAYVCALLSLAAVAAALVSRQHAQR